MQADCVILLLMRRQSTQQILAGSNEAQVAGSVSPATACLTPGDGEEGLMVMSFDFKQCLESVPLCVEVDCDKEDGRFDLVKVSVLPFYVEITDRLSKADLEDVERQALEAAREEG